MWNLVLLMFISIDTLYLSKSDAIRYALENSPLISASEAQVKSAEAKKLATRSIFLPQVKIDGSYRRVSLVQEMKSFQVDSLIPTPSGALIPMGHYVSIPFGQKDNYNVNIGVSQVVFSWGNLLRGYKMAALNLYDQMLQDSISKKNLELQISQLYDYALVAQEFIKLAYKVDEELREHYETTQRKYALGTATEIELLQAESKYKNNKIQILDAERSYKELMDLLKILIGASPEATLILTDSLYIDSDHVKSLLTAELDPEKRYDLRSLNLKEKILDLSEKNSSTSNLPMVFYSFNYLIQKPFGFDNIWKDYWALTVGISFPIFDGFKGTYESRAVQFQKKALQYSFEFQKNTSLIEFERAKRNLEIAFQKYLTQLENLRVAETLYNTVKTQYERGLATHLDYIDAETNYFYQRALTLQVLADCRAKAIEVEKALLGIK